MKLYDCKDVVNPRRVRMLLAEKGMEVDAVPVDVLKGEHRHAAFVAINPLAAVPCLELDDGTVLAECEAIAQYLEAAQPQPAMLGGTPRDRGLVAMWQRRVAEGLLDAAVAYFHHATPGLGEPERYRNHAWGEANRQRVASTMALLDRELANHPFIAGDSFSFADITALCGVDFAGMLGIAIPTDCSRLQAWHDRVATRPSAAA